MQIENGSGALTGTPIEWPGGPGIFESTSVANDQVVALERLGGNGLTWVPVGDNAIQTGNAVVAFTLDRSMIRLDMASGTSVYADVKTRRFSP